MIDPKVLGEQAYRLTKSCLDRRDQPSLMHTEKVAAMTLKMLQAEMPIEEIEWVLVNAKVLTEAGIEYTRNNRPPNRRHLSLVTVPPPWVPSADERAEVRGIIRNTRAALKDPKGRSENQ